MSASRCTSRLPRVSLLALTLLALVTGSPDATASDESSKPPDAPLEFVTDHALQLPEGELRYRAVASETWLRDDKDEPPASFFTIAYTRAEEYRGGHMMYLHRESFERLSDDLAEFVTTARP